MKNKVTVFSYYSAEELTGIGKYNGEMMTWLVDNQVDVVSFSNAPFYPKWKTYDGYKNSIYTKNIRNNGMKEIRTWTFIPSTPSSVKKILSEFTFFVSSGIALLFNFNVIRRADLIVVVCPPFFLGLLPLFFAKIFNTTVLNHIQDLQVDAAKELKLLPKSLCFILEKIEKFILKHSNYVSTISEGMKKKLEQKNINKEIMLLPNWSNLDEIKPIDSNKWLHNELGLKADKKLIVYSGNLGEKQGLEIIVEAANKLQHDDTIHFVILGEGLFKEKLMDIIHRERLPNITVSGLVSLESLNKMLNDSFIQLVIQKSSAADSFLPSKLTNILASGCASIVTTNPETSLYEILHEGQSALIIKPESSDELVNGINYLINNEVERQRIKIAARKWAEEKLSISNCLSPLMSLIK